MDLTATKRSPGEATKLRKTGYLPAIAYNKKQNIPVSVELRAFDKVFRSQGTSRVIDLNIEGQAEEVLVKAVHMNKRTRLPQHVDFYILTAGQKVDVDVKIDFVGTPIGVRNGGMADVQRREVRVNILPRLIPGTIEVDVTHLEINDSMHMGEIVDLLPAEAEILEELERTIIAIVPPRVETEPTDVEEDLSMEPEVIGAKDDDEEGDDSEQ